MSRTNVMTPVSEKRHRSPSVPWIGPTDAAMRGYQLYKSAGRDWVSPADAAKVWGLGRKSSNGQRIVAALIAYGLVEANAESGGRRIRISDMAAPVFALPDPSYEQAEGLFVEAALKPKLIAEYAKRWVDGRPGDAAAITQLKLRYPFTDETAAHFLKIFDLCMERVRGQPGVPAQPETHIPKAPQPMPPDPEKKPPQPMRTHPDNVPQAALIGGLDVAAQQELNRPKIVHEGPRLEISAKLDGAGLRHLLRMLPAYREVLETSLPTTDQQAGPAAPQLRLAHRPEHCSAAFPVLGFQSAHQHAYWLNRYAGLQPISIEEAAKMWSEYDLEPGSTHFYQTIDGLLEFGLCELLDSGEAQKIRMSDLGSLAFQHIDEELGLRAFHTVATKPKLLAHYLEKWGDPRPEDAVCLPQLEGEQGFTEQLARRFLRVFDEITFSAGKPKLDPDNIPDPRLLSNSEIAVLQRGVELLLSVSVDLPAMGKLAETLSYYERVLRLWVPPTWGAPPPRSE